MKILFYILTVLLGVFGLASVLRFAERTLTGVEGSGSPIVQLVTGAICIALAHKSFKKARGGTQIEQATASQG